MMHSLVGSRYAQRLEIPPEAMSRTSRAARLLFCILWLLAVSVVSVRADDGTSEYQVKAAFLYNFTKYVEWPQNAFGDNPTFTIGIVGKDPFGRMLEKTIEGKSADGKEIVIKRFARADDVQPCPILFVSESEKNKVGKILEQLGKSGTLTVSESDQFLQRGGIINFVIQNDRVRFEINTGAADRAGIKISSRLLSLAKNVRS